MRFTRMQQKRSFPRARPWGLLFALALPVAAFAQVKTTVNQAPKPPEAAASAVKALAVSTQHTVVINGRQVAYTATAGTIILNNSDEKPTASIFYIAYTEDKPAGPAARPVTFLYNGGPGAASCLVNFGGFGPRKIVWPQPGSTVAVRPPYQIVPNPDTLLATSDLVFVDAVGTGYSRIISPAGTAKMFYGVKQDADSFVQFIRQYLSEYGRWNSPKFLLGESYGTMRSAVLANELVRHGVYLNGVILCSTVLMSPTISFAPGDDLPYILYLPSYAATAWYHHKLNPEPSSLPNLIARAEAFASGPYASALFQGSALPVSQAASLAKQLSSLTGLPASLWIKARLRIPLPVFSRNLLGDEEEMTGRYDSRYTIAALQPLLPFAGTDNIGATNSAISGALTAASNHYIESRLNYHSQREYRQLNYTVNSQWDWKYSPPVQDLLGQGEMYLNVAPALARAMTNDPGLDVMVNNGYFDMATPFFATEYTFRHTTLPPDAEKRITWDYYECGHMLYLNPKVLPAISANINRFIAGASASH